MASIPTSNFDVAVLPEAGIRTKTNVLVVSSVALAFISFWRAAAIVLCDLASSAYYVGGISEQAVGKAAPWFILGIMLFSYAVRSVYVESCTMFTRGGVYKVVKEAMGGSLAKLSVSALMFDYILTGPISAVSAGQYLLGLFSDMADLVGIHLSSNHGAYHLADNHPQAVQYLSAFIAIFVTVYFWRANIIGIGESSSKAMKIMQATTVMGVIIIIWSSVTMYMRRHSLSLPPLHPVFTGTTAAGDPSSLGWLEHMPKLVGAVGILIAFGHSLLAMSGEESLAQVNREIEAPKLKNLLRAGFVIFIYSMLLTSLISFFAVLIIPDGKRVKTEIVTNGTETRTQIDYVRKDGDGRLWGHPLTIDAQDTDVVHQDDTKVVTLNPLTQHIERDNGGYRDNLINGLAHYLAGPNWARVALEAFVVIVGFLILSGAVNTSIVGSNGVLNRLAEDGVLTPWFLHPQKRFGTTHRLINLVVVLQLVTIVLSRGDVNMLGEAYAFGVVWSFVFKTLAMVVLRFKDKSHRLYEVPLNIRIKGREKDKEIDLPIGISLIFLVLLSTAMLNLMTKQTATIWGVTFTIAFLIVFIMLEKLSHRAHGGHHAHLEQFNEKLGDSISAEALGLTHLYPIVVAARGPRSLPVLERILKETDTDHTDVVVVTCKVLPPRTPGITETERGVDEGDRQILTGVVTVAEEVGKQVFPVILPTNNPLYAIATAARDLDAAEVVMGVSEVMHAEMQLEQFAMAWGMAQGESPSSVTPVVRIIGPQFEVKYKME